MKILAHSPYVGTTGYNSHCQNFFRRLSKFHDLKIRNCTVGKNWKGWAHINDNPHGADVDDVDKSILGVQTLYDADGKPHDWNLYGFDKTKYKQDLNIVLSEVNHSYFYDEYHGPKIAYTVWENTVYPSHFFDKLKEYDQIWVPSKWQAELTIQQGMPSEKVKVVPEGVNTELFNPIGSIKNKKFTFVVFGRWEARKSTLEIIRSFKNVFRDNDNVQLIISVDNIYSTDGLQSTEDRLRKYNLTSSNIKIIHFPSQKEYVNILKSAHVFISCARAEGWNLPLIEAMACGIPSIYSNCSGQLEFAENKGIPIEIVKMVSPIESKQYYSEKINNEMGYWYEPNFSMLESKLLDVYENYDKYQLKAQLEAKIIANNYNWDISVEIANNIINNMNKFVFVTCGNEKYMHLIEKLVKSINEFSNAKIIVYGVDCDVPFDYDCLIKRKLNIPKHSLHDKWYWKQYACIESLKEEFTNYVWIDGDVIVNHNIDNVKNYFSEIENYPIPDIHRNEEFFGTYTSNTVVKSQSFNENLCRYFNVNKKLPMAHVCLYVYNKNCKWWFEEIISVYKSIDLNRYEELLLWNDEGIDNMLRWKYKCNKYMRLSNFDTSGYDGDLGNTDSSIRDFYDFWNKNGPNNFGRVYGFQYIPEKKSDILYFHGNKNIKVADEMFEYIKHIKNNTFYKSESFFVDQNILKNLGKIKNEEGGTIEIASKYGWDYAIYHEIYNLQDYYLNRVKRIHDGDIVVDLGANIGIFNRWAYCQGASKVISFEPDKRYFNLLYLNTDKKFLLFNAAVTDTINETFLYESDHLGGSTVISNLTKNKYKVRTYTLDYLFESGLIDRIDFLKVDVEGAEHLVLKGISDFNLSKVKNIAMEYHHACFNYDENLRNNLISRLNKLGFNSHIIFLRDNNLQYIYFYK